MPIPILKPNEDGVFYAFWSDQRRSKRKSMGTSDPAVAQERFAQWLLLRNEKSEASDTAYTVRDCWTVYYKKHVLVDIVNPATAEYAWAALEPHFGDLTVPQVTQDQVDAYTRARLAGAPIPGRKRTQKVKGPTIRRELQVLFAALHFCAAAPQKMFSSALIEKVKLPPEGEPRDRWLRTDEMQRLFDAAARLRRGKRLSRGERFLWLALSTAGRMSAVLDLTWDRVDFETRVIHLDVPGRKKTKKRRASVPISDDLMPILRRAHAERINNLVMDNKADVWATVQWIAIEAGMGGGQARPERSKKPKATSISPNVLRHTAATHMARRGVPLWKIAKVLGNTLAMVEKVYAKHSPEDLRDAVNLVSGGMLEAAE